MSRRLHRSLVTLTCVFVLLTGCRPSQPVYLFDDGDLSHYRGVATEIEYPNIEVPSLSEVDGSLPPFTLRNSEIHEIWDVTLEEAVQISLANSKVLRQLGGTVQPASTPATQVAPSSLTRSPDFASTVYQPAIVETNPLNGVEAALSAFDAQFSTSVFWQRNDRPINLVSGGFADLIFAPILEQDLGSFTSEISKRTATGSLFTFRNNTAYEYNNNPTRLFPSDWNTNFEAEFRQPLLQGAGVQFNRIAGPNAQPGFGILSNGVVIARIRTDIALADFEANVRNVVADVETTYWELYFAYRFLDAQIAGRDAALQTWRKIYSSFVVGIRGGEAEKEAQAREQYFLFRGQVENALSNLYAIENRLRYMMGLGATDGRLIRPADEPSTARLAFDWYEVHSESLVRNPELRRQKWIIQQREMELIAARNFLLPRLDAVGTYRWRGFGDDLIGYNATQPFDNAFQTLFDGDFEEWQLGLQLNIPIGFRRELSAVRNSQLQLARDRAVLQDQELEVSHQLADALRDLDRFYVLSQTTFNRRVAAERQVEAVRAAYETQTVTLDVLLDAQRRLADSESAYYRSLVDYNRSIMNVHYRKGSLLEYNGVFLNEGPWPAKAYFDARKRARERDAALFFNYGFTQPRVISRGPFSQHLNIEGGGVILQEEMPQIERPESIPTPAPLPENQPVVLPPGHAARFPAVRAGGPGALPSAAAPPSDPLQRAIQQALSHEAPASPPATPTYHYPTSSAPVLTNRHEGVATYPPAGAVSPVAGWTGTQR